MLKNIGIYACRGFEDVMADAAQPPPAGRTGHCAGAPTGPASWSSARLDSLQTKGAVPWVLPTSFPHATAVKGPDHRVVPTYLVNLKLEKLEILTLPQSRL
jgi:hypothetical protein